LLVLCIQLRVYGEVNIVLRPTTDISIPHFISSPYVNMSFYYSSPPKLNIPLEVIYNGPKMPTFKYTFRVNIYKKLTKKFNIEQKRANWSFWLSNESPYCEFIYRYRTWVLETSAEDTCYDEMVKRRCNLVQYTTYNENEFFVTKTTSLFCMGYKDRTHKEWTTPFEIPSSDALGPVHFLRTETEYIRLAPWVRKYTLITFEKKSYDNWGAAHGAYSTYNISQMLMLRGSALGSILIGDHSTLEVAPGMHSFDSEELSFHDLPNRPEHLEEYFRDRSPKIHTHKFLPSFVYIQRPFQPIEVRMPDRFYNTTKSGHLTSVKIESTYPEWYSCSAYGNCKPAVELNKIPFSPELQDEYKPIIERISVILTVIATWFRNNVFEPILVMFLGKNWMMTAAKHLVILAFTNYYTSGNLYLTLVGYLLIILTFFF